MLGGSMEETEFPRGIFQNANSMFVSFFYTAIS